MLLAWLAVSWLWFLPLVVVPILIHFLSRRGTSNIAFPATRLLQKIERARRKRHWLRDAGVLILRMILLAAAVFALAGALWPRQQGLDQAQPFVVILDGSASMHHGRGGVTAFTAGLAAVSDIFNHNRSQPGALLLADGSGRRSHMEPSVDHAAVRALLYQAEASFGHGTLAATLQEALAMLPNGGRVFVVTDRSSRSLTGVDSRNWPQHTQLQLVPVGTGGSNQAITAIACKPGRGTPGKALQVEITVQNFSDQEVSCGLLVHCGEQRFTTRLVLPPGGQQQQSHSLLFDQPGSYVVTAKLVDRGTVVDVLPADDERMGIIEIADRLEALVVGTDAPSNQRGAVRPLLAGAQAAGFQTYNRTAGGKTAWPRVDLVMSAGLHRSDASFIRSHLDQGGAWLQFVHNGEDLAYARGAVPGLAAPVQIRDLISVVDQGNGYLGLAGARLEHPVLQGFFGREVLLEQLEVYRFCPSHVLGGSHALMTLADGSVALTEQRIGDGRWLLMSFSLAEESSNIARLDLLPLMATRLAGLVIPERKDHCALLCGSVQATSWIHDQGVTPAQAGQYALSWPGIYYSADEKESVLAAAIPGSESDVQLLDDEYLAALQMEQGAAQLAELHDQQPLWHWFLLLALIAMAAELLLLGPLARRQA